MDKSRFVGWREGANCLSLCKETLKKYGLSNYGSSLNVFKLVDSANGLLTNWEMIQLKTTKMQLNVSINISMQNELS